MNTYNLRKKVLSTGGKLYIPHELEIPLLSIYPTEMCVPRGTYKSVQNTVILNTSKLEMTQKPIIKKRDKLIVVYFYNEVLQNN